MIIKVRVIKRNSLVKDKERGMSQCPSSISMIHNTFSADSNEGKKSSKQSIIFEKKVSKNRENSHRVR